MRKMSLHKTNRLCMHTAYRLLAVAFMFLTLPAVVKADSGVGPGQWIDLDPSNPTRDLGGQLSTSSKVYFVVGGGCTVDLYLVSSGIPRPTFREIPAKGSTVLRGGLVVDSFIPGITSGRLYWALALNQPGEGGTCCVIYEFDPPDFSRSPC
jgi:hypothetical protein